jgi:aminoglycoside/choline kinase family phosphotransferase
MVAPCRTQADRDSFLAFLRVAEFLLGHNLAAPDILAVDAEAGLILMEDFGDQSVAGLLQSPIGPEAYRTAAEIPDRLSELPAPDWAARPAIDEQAAMVEVTLAQIPQSNDLAAALVTGLETALTRFAGGPPALSLRDYHGENLIWRDGATGLRRVGLLDFQDAVMLPLGYDLASLVDDPRREVPAGLRADLIERFAVRHGLSPEAARSRVDTLSLLRNLRILGIFHRLAGQGKPAYRRFLPRTMALIASAADNPDLRLLRGPVSETLSRVADWVEGAVP